MSGLMKICVLLMVTFVVIGSVMVGVAGLTGHDPFDSDSRVLPPPISALTDYSCLLRLSETRDSASVFCEFTAEQGSSDDSPVKTVVIRSDNLRLGDLFLCLGVPTNVQHLSFVHGENMVNLLWSDPSSAAWSDLNGAHLNYFLPIIYLSMESDGKAPLCFST